MIWFVLQFILAVWALYAVWAVVCVLWFAITGLIKGDR